MYSSSTSIRGPSEYDLFGSWMPAGRLFRVMVPYRYMDHDNFGHEISIFREGEFETQR